MSFSLKKFAAGGLGAGAVLGAVGGLLGGGDDGNAPVIDPRVQQNAYKMSDIGGERYSWAQEQDKKLAPMFDRLGGIAGGVADDGAMRSDALWKTYTDTFAPVTDRVATDAMGWDSAQNLEAAAADATATVGKSYAQAANRRGAMMAKYGINPATALRMSEGANLQQAADEAVAANAARDARRTMGVQLRTGAAQLGRGVAADSMNADSVALAGAGAGANIAATGVNTSNAATDSALPWFTGSNSALLGTNQAQMQAYQAQQQASAARSQGIGQLIGTIGGAVIGGPMGAAIGGSLGGAVAKPKAAGADLPV